jgi:ornithine carbamoyltransferase
MGPPLVGSEPFAVSQVAVLRVAQKGSLVMKATHDCLAVSDLDQQSIERIADRALVLADSWRKRDMPQTLKGARVGLIAELPGWRNPTALALGVQAMGGLAVTSTAKLEGAETPDDIAGYLDNWFDLLAIRTPSLSKLGVLARALQAPVINLRTNDNHPCEILGDLAYVLTQRQAWDGLRVSVVGPAGNIARSWVEAANVLPIQVTQVAPRELLFGAPDLHGSAVSTDDERSMEDADVIITDCWPPAPSPELQKEWRRFSIDRSILERCRPETLFIPCPPVTRGQEVSADAMSDERCRVIEAKAYLMHIQNALVEWALQ